MRTQGTLTQWNEAKGTGVLSPEDGSADVAVIMASMPRDGLRPRLGETLSFEVVTGDDGVPRAMNVWRLTDRASKADVARRRRVGNERVAMLVKAALALAAIAVLWAYFGR